MVKLWFFSFLVYFACFFFSFYFDPKFVYRWICLLSCSAVRFILSPRNWYRIRVGRFWYICNFYAISNSYLPYTTRTYCLAHGFSFICLVLCLHAHKLTNSIRRLKASKHSPFGSTDANGQTWRIQSLFTIHELLIHLA